MGGTLIVGIFVPTITIPLGLIGSTCSPLIVFILPCLIFLAMHDRGLLKDDAGGAMSGLVRRARAVLYIGYALIPLCTIIWIKGVAS